MVEMPMLECGKYNVVFLVKKKIRARVFWFVKYDEFNVKKKMIEKFENLLNFCS